MTTINKIAKAGILGGLIMSAVVLKATNPITNINKTPNQNQTEIISKEGAAALRAASLQGVRQAAIPTTHNEKLDNTIKKFIGDDGDRVAINYLTNNVYKAQGTFLGSVLIQFDIDRRALYHFMKGNTKLFKNNGINPELAKTIESFGDKFYTTITPKQDKVSNWLYENYSSVLTGNLYFDQKPNAKEVIDRLDYIATDITNFNSDEKTEYFAYCDWYKDTILKNKTDNQSMADYAAYKMFLIDKLMFAKELKGAGVFFGDGHFENGSNNLTDYYKTWMESVNPAKH